MFLISFAEVDQAPAFDHRRIHDDVVAVDGFGNLLAVNGRSC